eukprot:COSAG02_NODE_2483_length_8721_cov_37.896312_6_plen_31_part_00
MHVDLAIYVSSATAVARLDERGYDMVLRHS